MKMIECDDDERIFPGAFRPLYILFRSYSKAHGMNEITYRIENFPRGPRNKVPLIPWFNEPVDCVGVNEGLFGGGRLNPILGQSIFLIERTSLGQLSHRGSFPAPFHDFAAGPGAHRPNIEDHESSGTSV